MSFWNTFVFSLIEIRIIIFWAILDIMTFFIASVTNISIRRYVLIEFWILLIRRWKASSSSYSLLPHLTIFIAKTLTSSSLVKLVNFEIHFI